MPRLVRRVFLALVGVAGVITGRTYYSAWDYFMDQRAAWRSSNAIHTPNTLIAGRSEQLAALKAGYKKRYDILVIDGGATGAVPG